MMMSSSSGSSLLPHEMKRLDEPLEILVRLDVADIQQIRVAQLVPLARIDDVLFARRHAESIVDGVRRDDDLVRRHVEELQDVALGLLGHGEDAIGLVRRRVERGSRERVAETVSKVLREHQVNAVVNRDDAARRRQRGQHVVRRVKQIELLAPAPPAESKSVRRASSAPSVSATARKFSPSEAATLMSSGLVMSTYSVVWSIFASSRSRFRM